MPGIQPGRGYYHRNGCYGYIWISDPQNFEEVQEQVAEEIGYATSLNILAVNVTARRVMLLKDEQSEDGGGFMYKIRKSIAPAIKFMKVDVLRPEKPCPASLSYPRYGRRRADSADHSR